MHGQPFRDAQQGPCGPDSHTYVLPSHPSLLKRGCPCTQTNAELDENEISALASGVPPRHFGGVKGWTVPGLLRTQFATTDPDVARELMSAAYVDAKLHFSGSREGLRLEHVRYDLGPVRLDSVHHTLTTDYVAGPFGCLQIVRIVDHTMTNETDGHVQHFGPGEVFLAAQPDKSFAARVDQTRLQTIGLDLPLLARVSDEPPLEAIRRFRADALPVAQTDFWQRAVTYATSTLSRPGAEAPLVLDALRRLLASAALTAFIPEVAFDVPRDRTDATPTTVRRAVAYLEANPDLEIGVADVARAAQVSIRALQLAFRRHLDTTPMAYLRRVRLDRVYADLAAADPRETTVTAVTARWGFPAVGRFSADYRNTYGEYPRDTLRRR